ncbi:MAG: hypothetical protein LBE84_10575 [Planctomycetota bacterium]|jgi:hypothetical protein|nr:hypothetical protein [Planctomycetota bacterium]
MNPLERRIERLESMAGRRTAPPIDMDVNAACTCALLRGMLCGGDEHLAEVEAVRKRYPEVCARIESELVPMLAESEGFDVTGQAG